MTSLSRVAPLLLLVGLTLVLGAEAARCGLTLFTGQAVNSANTFTADTLAPPTSLTASVVGSSIQLNWTATVDTYASGYVIARGTTPGGSYVTIGGASPRTVTTFTDTTPTPGTRYYYVVLSIYQLWSSVYSNEANAAVPANTGWLSPTAQAAVTSNAGDNNGFESNPTNAFADGGGYAEDVDSGTGSSQGCTSILRDSHLFYNYGFTIPSGQTINGIEVRLDAWADTASFSPKTCVQLSWDGGTTWTTAKITTNLTTSEQTYTLGSTTDAWGHTWSSTDFSNANFRVRITNVASDTLTDFRLDWVPVRVTYTPP